PDFAEVDADFALYEGFIGQQDRLTCNQLLAATPEQLAGWEADTFQDERLQTLLFRYRARNYPYSLTDQEIRDWQNFCQRRLIEGEFGAGLTVQQFQQQLITLAQKEEGSREQQLLSQLSAWVQGRLG
ncbi:MAG: exodeoxyribonuclease I, partial [Hyphomicrobiales bacterium]|nr:exodeoxyribonuclease I [Hyphomicrobiales bacterium]